MLLKDVVGLASDWEYVWPGADREVYGSCVDYRAIAWDGEHEVRVGFGMRPTYGQDRKRVVIWIDGYPEAEFLGADDFNATGDVLSEIRVPGDSRDRMCRYPDEAVPERYCAFPVIGLPARVTGPKVHNAWAVVANIGDHRVLCALAGLRRLERRG